MGRLNFHWVGEKNPLGRVPLGLLQRGVKRHDNREICTVCSHNIPIDRKHVKEELKKCFDCGAVRHYNRKKSKETCYPPEEEGDYLCYLGV